MCPNVRIVLVLQLHQTRDHRVFRPPPTPPPPKTTLFTLATFSADFQAKASFSYATGVYVLLADSRYGVATIDADLPYKALH